MSDRKFFIFLDFDSCPLLGKFCQVESRQFTGNLCQRGQCAAMADGWLRSSANWRCQYIAEWQADVVNGRVLQPSFLDSCLQLVDVVVAWSPVVPVYHLPVLGVFGVPPRHAQARHHHYHRQHGGELPDHFVVFISLLSHTGAGGDAE